MKRLRHVLYILAVLLIGGGSLAFAANVGPVMIQNDGSDIDNPALFLQNLGACFTAHQAGCPNTSSATVNYVGHLQTNAVDVISKIISPARLNNPHVNLLPLPTSTPQPMVAPPVITTAGCSDHSCANGSLTVDFPWNGTNSSTGAWGQTGVFNFYGGLVTPDAQGGTIILSTNYSATPGPPTTSLIPSVEFISDSALFQVHFLNYGVGTFRLVIDGQYVSSTPTSLASGYNTYIFVNFAAVGGRATHRIKVEFNGADFYDVAVAPTEAIYKPPGTVSTLVVQGDSIVYGVGAVTLYDAYLYRLGDELGIRNVWNDGVQGTGYIANGSGTQLTCVQRVPTLIAAAQQQPPNSVILMLECGLNDSSQTAAAIEAAVTAELTAIRASAYLAKAPIIVAPVWTTVAATTSKAAEAAIQTAVSAFIAANNDQLIFMVPTENDPNGPWMTGTGPATGNASCTTYVAGNAAAYISSLAGAVCLHPSSVGAAWYADRFYDALSRLVFVP